MLAMVTAAGCGNDGGQPDTAAPTPPPTSPTDSPGLAAAKSLMVKIDGTASDCGKTLAGSGFVVAPNRVMGAADTVAGADPDSIQVAFDGTRHDAHVVLFDPDLNVLILDVSDLTGPPLPIADELVSAGTQGLLLGYPNAWDLVATPATVRETITLRAPTSTVRRPWTARCTWSTRRCNRAIRAVR